MARKKAVRKSGARTAGKPAKAVFKKKVSVAPASQNLDVRAIRQSLGMTRREFSRLSQFSERTIANWETGEPLSATSRQRLVELKRLQGALSKVIEPDYVGKWLQTPNEAFGGLTPQEAIERGETDRIWRMIYLLESGVPS